MGKRKRWRQYAVGKYRLGRHRKCAVAFWYDESGNRKQVKLGQTNESAARTALDQFAAKAELIQPPDEKTIGHLFEQYLTEKVKDGKNPKNFLNSWKALAPRFKEAIPQNITEDICRSYAKDRFKLGLSPSSVWTELLQLRTLINWSVKTRRLKADDARYVWLPNKSKPRERVMSSEEIRSFIEHATTPHIKLFFIMAFTTGARMSAILEMKWDQIDFENDVIDLRGEYVYDPMSKTRQKRRAIQKLTRYAKAALLNAREGSISKYVIEWNGKPVKSIKKAFKRTCDKAGIEGVSPHTVRHTTGTLMRKDAPLEVVSEWLGHSDLEITKRVYAKTTPEYFEGAAQIIDQNLSD